MEQPIRDILPFVLESPSPGGRIPISRMLRLLNYFVSFYYKTIGLKIAKITIRKHNLASGNPTRMLSFRGSPPEADDRTRLWRTCSTSYLELKTFSCFVVPLARGMKDYYENMGDNTILTIPAKAGIQ
jgi:hypothetical protein